MSSERTDRTYTQDILKTLAGAAVAIFTFAASNDAEAQTQRNRLSLQDYCTQSTPLFENLNEINTQIQTALRQSRRNVLPPLEEEKERLSRILVEFIANNTPFQAGAAAQAPFSSKYGSINVSVPAETFIVFCNPNKTEWTQDDVRLLETGGTLSAIHNSLGSYNARDPENITRIANLAALDISIGSRFTEPMIDHMQSSHGMRIKVIANGQSSDSADLLALKADALQNLIP